MRKHESITELLVSALAGSAEAERKLFDEVYDELRQIAKRHVRRLGNQLTINPTTLVHETWIKFSTANLKSIESSVHFYNTVARAMRQILLDLTDRKAAIKRGGEHVREALTDGLESEHKPIEDLLAIHNALDALKVCDEDLSVVVEWHYFAGLSVAEIAQLRQVSERTVKRYLAMGRAFIHCELE
jgi:RNA polymerase sigma factor (TIGR02999 family)